LVAKALLREGKKKKQVQAAREVQMQKKTPGRREWEKEIPRNHSNSGEGSFLPSRVRVIGAKLQTE
jgi:hypothetical protein